MRTGILLSLVRFFPTLLFANTVTAVTTNVSPGDWSAGGSWSSGTVPQSGDLVVIPAGKAVSVSNQVHTSTAPTLIIRVTGELDFHPSGKLDLSSTSTLQLFVGGKIIPQNSASSQLIILGGVTKYNAANNGTLAGPAFADALSGSSVSGQPQSGFSSGVLPVTFTGFSAKLQNDGVVLQWQTVNEKSVRDFVVERSDDGGLTWLERSVVAAKGGPASYSFVDRLTLNEAALFRIKARDQDQRFSYSFVLNVGNKSNLGVALTPNPVKDQFQVSFSRPQAVRYAFSLLMFLAAWCEQRKGMEAKTVLA